VKKAGYIKTNSEIEALILEANLIKKYQPKYNIVWRDDKNYFYIVITKEDFPVVSITHQPKLAENSSLPIGPFVEGTALKRTLTYLRKVFPYYTLRPGSGQAAKKHPRGNCLWCSLKLCPGPSPVKSEYQKNIKNLVQVLKGKSKKVLKNLKTKMNRFSVLQEYEKAAKIRNQILALEKILAHSKVLRESESPCLKKKRIYPLCLRKVWQGIRRIEAYDVSNIQGKEAAGSMVTFIDGKPDKNFYRRFKIKTEGKPNDVAMLKEILNRRLKHPEWPYPDLILIDGGRAQFNAALKCKIKNAPKENKFPTGQAKCKNIKIMALAKKENKLYIEGRKKPILLKSLSREIFNLILQLRDEAHRFAITYHHKLRIKTLIK